MEVNKKLLRKGTVPSIFPWTTKTEVTARGERQRSRDCRKRLFTFSENSAILGPSPSTEHFQQVEMAAPLTKPQPSVILSQNKQLISGTQDNTGPLQKVQVAAPSTDYLDINEVEVEISIAEHQPSVTISQTKESTSKPQFSVAATQTEELQSSILATQTSNILRFFSTELLQTDEQAVMYYTGLESYQKFNLVLQTLMPMANNLKYRWSRVLSLSVEDQFLILLIKLRCNKPDYEISKMFGISKTEVSNIFVTWVNFVHDMWSLIDIWPSRELVNFYMPQTFRKHHPSTRIVIDGTEIPIQKPSQPNDQRASFSQYKHKNTLKFLVASSPGGLITYCSPAYAGSVSDRQIVERSRLLQSCNQGDSIMADRGFNVQDLFISKGVNVNIPTFLKGKSQIPGILLKKDQELARERVHIERLIGLTKTYKVLTSELNHFYVPLASKIFFVCVMLCNFKEGIVPK